MVHSHDHTGASDTWHRGTDAAPRGGSGSGAGGRGHAEGGAASREAAGLVLFKTSPEQTTLSSPPQREKPQAVISFDKRTQKLNRLKRLKRAVWLSGQLHNLAKPGFRPYVPHFVTLTYRFVGQWRPNHIAEALDRYRNWAKKRQIEVRYTWVAELQGRGAVHYHLAVWLPVGKKMPFWDRARKVKGKQPKPFWTHGTTNTQLLQHGVSYLMKYLSKMGEFHDFPDGLRLYGMGGLSPQARLIRQWQNLPLWVKCDHGVGDVKRAGSSWVDQETGEILPPMWRRRFVPGGVELFQLRPMPEKIFDHGPFSTLH
jgi:hypothetical protein